MWTFISAVLLVFLYFVSLYNGLKIYLRQISNTKKVINQQKESLNPDYKKIDDLIKFHNNLVVKFNKQLGIFPTSIVVKLFKINSESLL